MLGHQKCGTTTIAEDLLSAGVRSPFGILKELHTFDRFCNFTLIGVRIDQWKAGRDVPEKMGQCHFGRDAQERWASGFSTECSLEEDGTLADMTPLYLRLPSLSQVFSELYGERRSRLGFIVALRDPLSRLQSAYYHEMRAVNLRGLENTLGMPGSVQPDEGLQGFEGYARALGTRFFELGSATDVVEQDYALDQLYRSLYYRNLKPWFAAFRANQFVIVPAMAYFKNETFRAKTLQRIGDQFGASVNASSIIGMPLTKENPIDHAPLSEDLKNETVTWLEEHIFRPDRKNLVHMLASSIHSGVSIVGYGGLAEASAIEEYLMQSW